MVPSLTENVWDSFAHLFSAEMHLKPGCCLCRNHVIPVAVSEHSDGIHLPPVTPVSKSVSDSTHPLPNKTLGAVLDVSFLSISQSFSYCALPMLLHLFRVCLLLLTFGTTARAQVSIFLPGPQHLLYCPCPCLQCGSLTPNPCHIMVAFIIKGNAYLEVNESFFASVFIFSFFSCISFPPFLLLFLSVLHAHTAIRTLCLVLSNSPSPKKREKDDSRGSSVFTGL